MMTENNDKSGRISTDYFGANMDKVPADWAYQIPEQEKRPRRKMHTSVNVSMTPDQTDYIDSKCGNPKTSVWIRRLIQQVYSDFPVMEIDNKKKDTEQQG